MFPVLFHIGSFAVHTYGVVLMAAFMVSIYIAFRMAQRRIAQDKPWPITPEQVLDLGIWLVVAGLVGARVMFVALDWEMYSAHPSDMFRVWQGGLSFHGGFFGGLIALSIFCIRHRIPVLSMADLYAPGCMLGYAIGRVGCFLNGCCYGAPTSMPWGIRFHDDGVLTPPSHPTQLYSVALGLLSFALLLHLQKRQSFRGQLSCWFFILAGAERFIMEIWRANVTSTVVALGMTDVQLLCLSFIALGVVGLAICRRLPALRASASLPSSRIASIS